MINYKVLLIVLLIIVCCSASELCPTSVTNPSTTCKFGSYNKTFTIDNIPCPTSPVTLCCDEPQRDNIPDCLQWNTIMCADDQCVKAYVCKERCPPTKPKDITQIHTCKTWVNDIDPSNGCHIGYKCEEQCPPPIILSSNCTNDDDNELESIIGSDGICIQAKICKKDIANCPDPTPSKDGQCCTGPNQHFILTRRSDNYCPTYLCQCKPKNSNTIVCPRGQVAIDSIDSDGCEYRQCQCQNKANQCPDTICEGKFTNIGGRVTLSKNFENKCITECACQVQTRKCLSDIHIGDTKTERQCCTQTKSYDMLLLEQDIPEVSYQCDKTVCETSPFTTDMIQFNQK